MKLTTDIPTLDKQSSFGAYVSRPKGTPKAAILVIQEVFGVNDGIRKKCDDWAEKGYLAVAPDLFWRLEPGVELNWDDQALREKAFDLMNRNDPDKNILDIEATIHWIRGECKIAKVGAVGFCLGGKLAYMTATRTDIDATVGYYGVQIDEMLDEQHAISRPLMLHIPTADQFVPAQAQARMHEGLEDNAKVTLLDYQGLGHGFATEDGTRRDEEAATLADRRTAEFFTQHLG
ncbi:dienelactone hydrolase family protein [Croceicoccus sp. F390]|uniref:Dienelactone hydrolase family protein n=1 Tax=Croceicoccus esteveae TaxID=3075597 RepID=A0ABU2ZLD9_9SPHN|nr:dienelactone hydrolase family protein [Croceicoccus sp. F390]MDT0577041.1 dienelactone hydrolase family protein [Croceicoccus sp. F390]